MKIGFSFLGELFVSVDFTFVSGVSPKTQRSTTQMTQKRILLTCGKSTEKQLRYLWCLFSYGRTTAGGSVDVLQ